MPETFATALTEPFFDQNEPIVAMVEFKGRLLVASNIHIYELDPGTGKLRRLDRGGSHEIPRFGPPSG